VRRLLPLIFSVAFLAGLVAGALTPTTVTLPAVSYDFATPAPNSTSIAYGLGYEVIVQHVTGNFTVANYTAEIGAAASVAAIATVYQVGLGLGAETYSSGTLPEVSPIEMVVPPSATYTYTVTTTTTTTETTTETQTITQTETVTETLGSPSEPDTETAGDLEAVLSGSSSGVALAIIVVLLVMAGLVLLRR